MAKSSGKLTPCPPKKPLHKRKLLSLGEAAKLESLYKILASDTRLRLLHALARKGELCVNDLASSVNMRVQAVSNQLQRLVDGRIVGSRREGVQVFYRVVDPCVTVLLDRGLCLLEDADSL